MADLPREVVDAARRFADAHTARAAQAGTGTYFAKVTSVAPTLQISRRGKAITASRGLQYSAPAVGDWVLCMDIDSQPVVIQAMKV